jgi:hypothetical protein
MINDKEIIQAQNRELVEKQKYILELEQRLVIYRNANEKWDERVLELERRLAEMSEWEPVEMGEKVMCNCDDPQCYHCIEAVADSLIVYEDVSDERERTITVELPDGWAFCRRTSFNPNTGKKKIPWTFEQEICIALALFARKKGIDEGENAA